MTLGAQNIAMNSKSEVYEVLVVGASGGIGQALTRQLLSHTEISALHLTSRSDQIKLIAPAQQSIHHYQLDITDSGSIAGFTTKLQNNINGQLGLIINTAGILHGNDFAPERRLQDVQLSSMQRVLTTNCIGHALLISALQPLLPRKGRTVLASLSARVGSISDNRLGGWYSYRASKAALNQIIRTASIELKRHNPECICIGLHPGTVDTPLSEPFQQNVSDDQLFNPQKAARQLLDVINQTQPSDSGQIFAWDGQAVPA